MEHMDFNSTNEKRILSRAAQLQNPVNGSLELLPLCNMNCDMCYIRLSRKEVEAQGGLRDAEEWIQLGKEMAQAGVLFFTAYRRRTVNVSGISKTVQRIKKYGYDSDHQYQWNASG